MEEPPRRTFTTFVAKDMFWKDRVRMEVTTQISTWPSRWSFLLDEYEKMYQAMEGKRLLSPDTGTDVWSRWHGCTQPTTHEVKPVKMTKAKRKVAEKAQLPHVKAAPAKNFSTPRTTNGWYGYKHLHNGRNLVADREYCWRKGEARQRDLIKILKWPMDYYD